MKNKILTTTEAARYLNVHATTVKRWIMNGDLNAYREPGGRWRIPVDEFVAFAKNFGIPTAILEDLSESEPYMPQEPSRILICDDDELVRKFTRDLITREFSDVLIEESEDGINGCIQIGHFKPHVVVLDIHMPDMDGIKVAELVKSSSELCGIKLLIISGFLDDDKVSKLKGFGVEKIMEKPFKAIEFISALKELLDV